MKIKKDIKYFTLEELTKEMATIGQPPHRARQIFLWLYTKYVDSFKEMTNISKDLAAKLGEQFFIGGLELADRKKSKDGTEKFLWRLEDGKYIESVYIKAKTRKTLCLSTQVGCKFKCPFCASGMNGFKRNLTPGEITSQLISAQNLLGCRMTNIVFMGMGEPLDNFDNLAKSIKIINDKSGIALGARKITVSTCGIIPGIRKLKNLGIQVELSVSLHATNNKLRDELVPANRQYPLNDLIEECKSYTLQTGRVITLEYALINGKNNSTEDIERLTKIAKRIKAKVNLLECNEFKDLSASSIGKEALVKFKNRLTASGVTVTIRRSKGGDIAAACGQLAAEKQ